MPDEPRPDARSARTRDLVLTCMGAGILVWCLHTGISTALKQRLFDFRCFHEAAVAATQGENIYDAGTRGYIYPPLLASLIKPLGSLNIKEAGVLWSIASVLLIWLTAWLAAREISKRFQLLLNVPQTLAIAAFGVIIVADKLNRELKEGNCNVLVLLGVVLALRWVGTRPLLCALALAFAIHIKYLPIAFLPLMLVRGYWRDALATLLAIVALAFLPAIQFGWSTNLDYLRTALTGMNHMAGGSASGQAANIHPLAWEYSISIPSAAARAAERAGADPMWTWIGAGAAATLVFAAAWWMYRRAGIAMLWRNEQSAPATSQTRGVIAFEWYALLAVALAFSPQTVARHANMALPLAIMAGALALHGVGRSRRLAAIAAGLFFLGLTFPPGIDALDSVGKAWRSMGGISWCILAMVLILLASMSSHRPALDPDPKI